MASIFTQIINRQIPAHIIAEDTMCMAFLDIHPLQPGHTLVVPKQAVDYFFDLDDNVLAAILSLAKRVAIALAKIVPCVRVGMAVVGLEVPHAHLHLIPLQGAFDIDFKKQPLNYTQVELQNMAQQIRSVLETAIVSS